MSASAVTNCHAKCARIKATGARNASQSKYFQRSLERSKTIISEKHAFTEASYARHGGIIVVLCSEPHASQQHEIR